MVLTRQQGEAVWNRLCDDVLNAGADTLMRLAFQYNGGVITSIRNFLTAGPAVINALIYATAADPTVRQLNPGMKNDIVLFQQFLEQLRIDNNGNELSLAHWDAITEEQFAEFCDHHRVQARVPIPAVVAAPPFPVPAAPPQPQPPDLVREFKKSIKRDDSAYPVFKEQKNWNSWNREFTARARVHDVLDVLDSQFVPDPTIPGAVDLFIQKQAFLYNVFIKTIMTDTGRALVRRFEEDHDAQAIYASLTDYAIDSPAAALERDRLIEYVTTTKLGLDWRGTYVQFILHWKEQMRLLDELLPFNEQHPDNTKKRMLESAVRGIPELLAIRALDLNRSAIPGQAPLTYAQYTDVLISAATERDNLHATPAKSRRSVNQMSFDPFDTSSGDDYNDHTDDEPQAFNVFNATSNPARASVPSEIWHKLPVEFQQMIKDHNMTVPSNRSNPNMQKRGAKFQVKHTAMFPIDEDDNNVDPPDDNDAAEIVNNDNHNE